VSESCRSMRGRFEGRGRGAALHLGDTYWFVSMQIFGLSSVAVWDSDLSKAMY
jgi:hypothetical protein